MDLSVNDVELRTRDEVRRLVAGIHSGENGADNPDVVDAHFRLHHDAPDATYQIKTASVGGGGFAADRLQTMAAATARGAKTVIQTKGDEESDNGADPALVNNAAAAMIAASSDYPIDFEAMLLVNEPDLNRLIGQTEEYWTNLGRLSTQVERAEFWADSVQPLIDGLAAASNFPWGIWAGAIATPTRAEGYAATLVARHPTSAAAVDAFTFHIYSSDPRLIADFDIVQRVRDAFGRSLPVHIDEAAYGFVTYPARASNGFPLYREPTDRMVTFALALNIEALRAGVDHVGDFNLCDASFQMDQQTEDQGQGYFRYDGTERAAYLAHRLWAPLSTEQAAAHDVTLSETRPPHFHALGFRAANSRRGVLLVRAETSGAETATAYRNYHLRNLEPLSSLDPAVEAEAVALEAATDAALGTATTVDLTNLNGRLRLHGSYGAVSRDGNKTFTLRGNAAALVVER
jgi:hypothetical protein